MYGEDGLDPVGMEGKDGEPVMFSRVLSVVKASQKRRPRAPLRPLDANVAAGRSAAGQGAAGGVAAAMDVDGGGAAGVVVEQRGARGAAVDSRAGASGAVEGAGGGRLQALEGRHVLGTGVPCAMCASQKR